MRGPGYNPLLPSRKIRSTAHNVRFGFNSDHRAANSNATRGANTGD